MEDNRAGNEELLVARSNEGCDMCQRMKNRMEVPAGKLKLSEVPEKP